MGLFTIYTAVSLLIIFISITAITFYIIKVAEKKYSRQFEIIQVLSEMLLENSKGILILKENLIIYEKEFFDDDITESKLRNSKNNNKYIDTKSLDDDISLKKKDIELNKNKYVIYIK